MKMGYCSKKQKAFVRRTMWPLVVFAAILLTSGCAAPEKRRQRSSQEILEEERRAGDRWALGIVKSLVSREDAFLQEKIAEVAAKFGAAVSPRVTIYTSAVTQSRSPVFVLPGYRWYFSAGALKPLKTDNEFAAAIAAAQSLSELVTHRREGATAEVAAASATEPLFVVPSFSESEWRSLNQRMVDLLYRAGYDPRGVLSFWQKSKSEWSGMSPDWSAVLQEEAFGQISRRVPLMNPVVRTREFSEIEKRLKRL